MSASTNIATENTAGRVDLRSKTVYGLGGLAENTMHNAVNNMANPVFNVGLGVSPFLIGLATAIFRLWDAITDPLMGMISDRFLSRWGRRRPFIVIGGILSSSLFTLVWWAPPGLGEMGYFFWFLFVCLLFYTAFTIFGVPYLALGFELSPDYHERTRVMAFRTWFASIGGIAIQWLFWLTQLDFFENTVEGMRWVGLGVGVLLLLCTLAPGLFLKERVLTQEEIDQNRAKVNLKSVFGVFKVKPFLFIIGSLTCAVLGMFMVAILGFYINVYYLFGGDLKASATIIGISGSFYHLVCLLSVPLVTWTSVRLGKRKTLILFLSVAVVGSAGKWWLFIPEAPYLQLVVTGLMAPGLSALWTILSSMIADITDYDELQTGMRREGSFGAIYNWTLKLGFAFCFLLSGFILEFSGFDESLGGAQSEATMTTLRLLYTVVPMLGISLAIALISFYPINEERANEIRESLKNRLVSVSDK